MRYQRDGWSVEQGLEKGRQPPDWFMQDLALGPMEEFYIREFFNLSTERQIGMSIGPIPFSKIEERGKKVGLEPDVQMVFEYVMRSMDSAYLEHITNENEKKLRRNKARNKKGRG